MSRSWSGALQPRPDLPPTLTPYSPPFAFFLPPLTLPHLAWSSATRHSIPYRPNKATIRQRSHRRGTGGSDSSIGLLRADVMQTSDSGESEAHGHFHGVLLGGTFDRLHEGHHSLLRTAVSCCCPECHSRVPTRGMADSQETEDPYGGKHCRIVVGISEGPLLENKFLKELIQPYAVREAAVLQFLAQEAERQGKPGAILLMCVPITTQAPERGCRDPSLDCLVLSEETRKGGGVLNATREKNGLLPLQVVVAPTVPCPKGKEDKLSSSALRRQSLGALLRQLPPPSSASLSAEHLRLQRGRGLGCPPYLIGLTGGIASGKSTVSAHLQAQGAKSVDCDRLAHKAYEPGTPAYDSIVEAFGPGILNGDKSVNRPALGAIVFSDKDKMRQLTGAVWPAVRRLVLEEQEHLAAGEGAEILLVEAAMMLEAGSQQTVDELWVVFAPEAVAKERLMRRNGIPEEEAVRRMKAQMPGTQRVAAADVAIFNGWAEDETRQLTTKAWALLSTRVRPQLDEWRKAVGAGPAGAGRDVWVRWRYALTRLGVEDEEKALQAFNNLFPHTTSPSTDGVKAPSRGGGREGAQGSEGHGEVPLGTGARLSTGSPGLSLASAFFQEFHCRAHFLHPPDAVKLALFFSASALGESTSPADDALPLETQWGAQARGMALERLSELGRGFQVSENPAFQEASEVLGGVTASEPDHDHSLFLSILEKGMRDYLNP